MKKGLLLLLGLFVAGLAAWAVPREQTAEKVKIEFIQKYDAVTAVSEIQVIDLIASLSFEAYPAIISTDYLGTRRAEVPKNRYRWCGSSYVSFNQAIKTDNNVLPHNRLSPANLARRLSCA